MMSGSSSLESTQTYFLVGVTQSLLSLLGRSRVVRETLRCCCRYFLQGEHKSRYNSRWSSEATLAVLFSRAT